MVEGTSHLPFIREMNLSQNWSYHAFPLYFIGQSGFLRLSPGLGGGDPCDWLKPIIIHSIESGNCHSSTIYRQEKCEKMFAEWADNSL